MNRQQKRTTLAGEWPLVANLAAMCCALGLLAWLLMHLGCASALASTAAPRHASAAHVYWMPASMAAALCSVPGDTAWCDGYLSGAEDMIVAATDGQHLWCAPSEVTLAELRATFLAYLETHEEEAREPAVRTFTRAAMERWPCHREDTTPPRKVVQGLDRLYSRAGVVTRW